MNAVMMPTTHSGIWCSNAEEDRRLAEEARQQRNARQRGRVRHERPVSHRQLRAQVAHLADIQLAVERVHYAARAEEQQCLEESGGGHQVEDAGGVPTPTATNMKPSCESRIGQDALEVRQASGRSCRPQMRWATPTHATQLPVAGARSKSTAEPRDHVHACGHHRRGMDEGRDRGRALHRAGATRRKRGSGRSLPVAARSINMVAAITAAAYAPTPSGASRTPR